jgi:outer membrane protein assembly factor BamA
VAQPASEEDNMLIARFTEVCADLGYLRAIVDVKRGEAGKTLGVQLGLQYRLRSIAVSGNKRFTAEQLLHGAPASGDIYSAGRVKKWIEGVLKKYRDAGAPAKIESTKLDFDHANRVVNLTVNLQEAL